MNKVTQLRSKREEVLSAAQSLLLDGLTSPEKRASYQKLMQDADNVEAEIRSNEKLNALYEKNPSLKPATSPAVATVTTPGVTHRSGSPEERKAKLNEAFRIYLKTNNYPEEFRDIFTASSGSPLIPQDVFPILGEVSKYYAPLLDYCTVELNTSARPTRFSTENDSSSFLTISSEGAAPSETDQTFSDAVLDHDLVTGTVKASLQLIDDSARFDLTQLITRAAGKRLGRSYESILTNGVDPASNPAPNNQGLINAATVGTTSTSLAAGIGMGDLANLVESLDPSYRSRAVFMFSGGTYQTLMKQVDGSGRRFWEELGEGRLWEWPVVINNALPQALVANGVPVLFGDFSTYAVSHTGLSAQVLYEKFIDQFKRGFQLSSRISSRLLSPGGIKALKLAAS